MRLAARLVSALLALAVAGAGGLTAAEVFVARVHGSWLPTPPLVVPYNTWLHELRTHSWSQNLPLWGSIGGIAAGLLLILLTVVPRGRRVGLRAETPDVSMTTSRGSIAQVLANEAKRNRALTDIRTSVTRTHARIRGTVRLGDADEIREQVEAATQSRLDSLALEDPPRLVVSVHKPRKRR